MADNITTTQANNGAESNNPVPVNVFSSQHSEYEMVFGFDGTQDYDEPDEKLLNSQAYRDAMIVKPEDVPEDIEAIIEHQRRHLPFVQPDELTDTTEPHQGVECATFSIREMAHYLGIGINRAYALVKVPGFPHIRVGHSIRIPKIALDNWIATNPNIETVLTRHRMK